VKRNAPPAIGGEVGAQQFQLIEQHGRCSIDRRPSAPQGGFLQCEEVRLLSRDLRRKQGSALRDGRVQDFVIRQFDTHTRRKTAQEFANDKSQVRSRIHVLGHYGDGHWVPRRARAFAIGLRQRDSGETKQEDQCGQQSGSSKLHNGSP
jgi:hypothetical protein